MSYCAYDYLIPWTSEGKAYAEKRREEEAREAAQKAARRENKKLALGRMRNARKRTRHLHAGKSFPKKRWIETLKEGA